jgi:chemotaxis protein methyltransferase CheR
MLVDDVRELTPEEYELFRALVYRHSGINLGSQKMQLVRARLGKRLRAGGFTSYRQYYDFVRGDRTGQELTLLIDAISTNTTHLFRESQHFEFLAATIRRWTDPPSGRRRTPIRIWSAGCSSGEEPYSIAMTVDDLLRERPGVLFKILATDISTRMLERARVGIFPADRLANVPPEFKHRYFVRLQQAGETCFQIVPALRESVRFARFNLMEERFPFRNRFDVIFCRNVMIYFDRPTQERLVASLDKVLCPGGYLLIGHSESLSSISHRLTYVRPTVYQKPGPMSRD